jgi:predicted nucleotidyltransferase
MALSALEHAALDDLRARLDARFGARLERFVLFGSRARGEGRADSDLDVLAVVRALSREERREAIDYAGEVEARTGLIVSAIVRDAEAWSANSGALAREIDRDGISP